MSFTRFPTYTRAREVYAKKSIDVVGANVKLKRKTILRDDDEHV